MSDLLPSTEPVECHSSPSVTAIEPLSDRVVQLGALEVHRVLPVRGRRLIGPWCFFDRFGPLHFAAEKPMDVAPHPHIGLQTVTWLMEGEIVHKDSLGSECVVRPGQLGLMTAGRGITHTEETPRDNSGKLDGVQLWVALPEQSRGIEPAYQCTADQPSIELAGAVITTILGEFEGAASAGLQFSPGVGAEVRVHRNSGAIVPMRREFEYGVLLASGDAAIGDMPLDRDTLYYLGSGRSELCIRSRDGAKLVLIGGVPFKETILMWWNFVARTTDEIMQAREAWERHEFFGDVLRYDGPRLQAPAFLGRPIPS